MGGCDGCGSDRLTSNLLPEKQIRTHATLRSAGKVLVEVKIVLVLPSRRLWPWHAALIAELARRGPLEVQLSPSRPYPVATRLWLALERVAFGHCGAAPIRPEGLGITATRQGGAFAEGDILIDLDAHAADGPADIGQADTGPPAGLRRRLSLRFNGQPDEAALFTALQGRRSPRLEVVEADGRVLAVSQAAVERRDELGRGLGYAHARLLALVLRALDGSSPASAPPPSTTAGGATLAGFVQQALPAKIAAKLSAGRSEQETWRVALRRAPGDDDGRPPGPTGFSLAAGPPDAFHADPFLFEHGGETFLFVEAYPWATRKGVIACARLGPDGRPQAFETVLEQPFHLSYPQVFAHRGEILMLPETASRRRLELYRASDFPRGWKRVAVMLEGLRIADATLLQYEDRWWLFASLAEHGGSSQDELFAWHGPSPFGPWTAHTRNPLVSDVRAGRPAGRFVQRGDRLYRPAQDSEAGYGSGLVWCEVLELTPETYREREAARWRGEDFGRFTGVHTFTEAGGFEAIDLKAPRGS